MKESVDFVSKLLRRGMDSDYDYLHLCHEIGHLQTHDGVVTLSHPSILVDKDESKEGTALSINGLKGINAVKICDKQSINVKVTEKRYIVSANVINFRAMFPYHKDYVPRIITKKHIKKATSLPPEFVKFVRSMASFTTKDSDHQFASTVNIINKRMYATNNIVVLRSTKDLKIKIKDCIIPRPLINALLKVKDDPTGIITNEQFIAFTYSSGAFAMCPQTTETAPNLADVFDSFKKPIPITTEDKESLLRSILMDSYGEVECSKGTVTTNNSEVTGVKVDDFKVSTDNLEMLLKIFDKVQFTRKHSFMQNDMFQAILAGRA